jgi:hypothetical protein
MQNAAGLSCSSNSSLLMPGQVRIDHQTGFASRIVVLEECLTGHVVFDSLARSLMRHQHRQRHRF